MSSDAPTDADGTRWPDISFVARSQYRDATVTYLDEHGPSMPSRIADATDSPIANISHGLRQLRDRGLVDLLVDEDVKKGRIYGLTDAGEQTAAELEGFQE